jgi:hypothetical protein
MRGGGREGEIKNREKGERRMYLAMIEIGRGRVEQKIIWGLTMSAK